MMIRALGGAQILEERHPILPTEINKLDVLKAIVKIDTLGIKNKPKRKNLDNLIGRELDSNF